MQVKLNKLIKKYINSKAVILRPLNTRQMKHIVYFVGSQKMKIMRGNIFNIHQQES